MSESNLRRMLCIEEPNLDDYVLCDQCGEYVFEYCSIHGPQLVIPDDKVYGRDNFRSHVVDASDASRSNWMRYVNCARHWHEQNLVAYQYRGQIYYCTIKTIPRFTELLVFYGTESADSLHIDLRSYNSDILSTSGFASPNKARNQEIMTVHHDKYDYENVTCSPNQTNENGQRFIRSDETSETKHATGTKADQRPFEVFSKSQEKIKPIPYTQSFFCNEGNCISDICGTDYSNLTSYVNEADRPFCCNTCQKCFKTNYDLKRHMSSHSTDRPFSCDVCKKSFKASSHVKKHMLTHSLDRPYCCDICFTRLKLKSSLKRHMLSHAPDRQGFCNLCKKSFKSAEHLRMHMFSHEPSGQYSCDTCQKSYKRKYTLKIHMRNHL